MKGRRTIGWPLAAVLAAAPFSKQGVEAYEVATRQAGNNAAPTEQVGSAGLSTTGRATYTAIAQRIIDKIMALRPTYPQLASLDPAQHVQENRERFSISLNYTVGETSPTNSDPLASEKIARRTVYDENGISLNLFFFEGEWTGTAAVQPIYLGDMRVVLLVRGPNTKSFMALERDLNKIIRDEKSAYDQGAF